MRRIELRLSFISYEDGEGLDTAAQALLQKARLTAGDAYAPYSTFHVGAAVLLENGEVVCGSNQENVAYPSGLCAERVALFAASSRFPGVCIQAVAVAAQTKLFTITDPVYPCGACRQVMAEYENHQQSPIRVLMAGAGSSAMEAACAADLLPLQFSADQLRKENK